MLHYCCFFSWLFFRLLLLQLVFLIILLIFLILVLLIILLLGSTTSFVNIRVTLRMPGVLKPCLLTSQGCWLTQSHFASLKTTYSRFPKLVGEGFAPKSFTPIQYRWLSSECPLTYPLSCTGGAKADSQRNKATRSNLKGNMYFMKSYTEFCASKNPIVSVSIHFAIGFFCSCTWRAKKLSRVMHMAISHIIV